MVATYGVEGVDANRLLPGGVLVWLPSCYLGESSCEEISPLVGFGI